MYASAGGEHQLKFGAQIDRVGNDVLNALKSRNLVSSALELRLLERACAAPTVTIRSAATPSNRRRGSSPRATIHTTNIGLFIQDSWTINNRLTINAGIRTERERVPTYQTGTDIPEFGVEFDFADKFAPRVGFAYDLEG